MPNGPFEMNESVLFVVCRLKLWIVKKKIDNLEKYFVDTLISLTISCPISLKHIQSEKIPWSHRKMASQYQPKKQYSLRCRSLAVTIIQNSEL